MKQKILEALKEIELNNNVKILYACESGSRSWNFASEDSDYDVRFIYMHPLDYYLSIVSNKRDVIDNYKSHNKTSLSEEFNLDLSGWDLKKALWLAYGSNPPFLEWINSPIVYYEHLDFLSSIRNLTEKNISKISLYYHYYNMAKTNFREYLKGDDVWLKKYLYVVRPLLVIKWLKENNNFIPVDFNKLIKEVDLDNEFKNALIDLVELKKSGNELKIGPRNPIIDDFIIDNLAEFRRSEDGKIFKELINNVDSNEILQSYDKFFRTMIDKNSKEK